MRASYPSTVQAWKSDFPSFSEGLSLRGCRLFRSCSASPPFPFLFGGTFIEGRAPGVTGETPWENFPSFSEGLSLRESIIENPASTSIDFPSFSEGLSLRASSGTGSMPKWAVDFPSFLEGLSLRQGRGWQVQDTPKISFPFGKGFH